MRDILEARLERRAIGQQLNINGIIFFCSQVQEVEAATVFEDDIFGTDTGEMDVELFEAGDLFELFGLDVVGPDIGALIFIAVRE